MNRVTVLTIIAERYRELVDPLTSSTGIRGTGDRNSLMPSTYTPTVREFERLVGKLRTGEPSLYWHLNEYHLKASTRTLWECPRCHVTSHHQRHVHAGKSGKPLEVEGRRTVVVDRHPGSSAIRAAQAVRWIAEGWGLSSEPMLPDELRVAA